MHIMIFESEGWLVFVAQTHAFFCSPEINAATYSLIA